MQSGWTRYGNRLQRSRAVTNSASRDDVSAIVRRNQGSLSVEAKAPNADKAEKLISYRKNGAPLQRRGPSASFEQETVKGRLRSGA
jgi:hypothetical protein